MRPGKIMFYVLLSPVGWILNGGGFIKKMDWIDNKHNNSKLKTVYKKY